MSAGRRGLRVLFVGLILVVARLSSASGNLGLVPFSVIDNTLAKEILASRSRDIGAHIALFEEIIGFQKLKAKTWALVVRSASRCRSSLEAKILSENNCLKEGTPAIVSRVFLKACDFSTDSLPTRHTLPPRRAGLPVIADKITYQSHQWYQKVISTHKSVPSLELISLPETSSGRQSGENHTIKAPPDKTARPAGSWWERLAHPRQTLEFRLGQAKRSLDQVFDDKQTPISTGLLTGLAASLLVLMWVAWRLMKQIPSWLSPLEARLPSLTGKLGVRLGIILTRNAFFIGLALWLGLAFVSLNLWKFFLAPALFHLFFALVALRIGCQMVRGAFGRRTAPGLIFLDPAAARFYRRHSKLFLAYLLLGSWGVFSLAPIWLALKSLSMLAHFYLAGLLALTLRLLPRPHINQLLMAISIPSWLARESLLNLIRCLLALSISLIVVAELLGFQNLTDYVAKAIALTGGGLLVLWFLGFLTKATLNSLLSWLKGKYPGREETLQKVSRLAQVLIAVSFGALFFFWTLEAWGLGIENVKRAFQWLTWGPTLGTVRLTPLRLGFVAVFIYFGYRFSTMGRRFLEAKVFPRADLGVGLQHAISKFWHYAVIISGALVALALLGLKFRDLAILAAALGLGSSLGLKTIGKDYASGMGLKLGRVVKEGDLLTIDGNLGRVNRIHLRTTVFRQNDGSFLIIPNSQMITTRTYMWTYLGWRHMRLTLTARVSYNANVREVTSIITDVCKANPRVVAEPSPSIFFQVFNDSSLDFTIWVHLRAPRDRMPATHELYRDIHQALVRAGVEVPLPQRDVHVQPLMKKQEQ